MSIYGHLWGGMFGAAVRYAFAPHPHHGTTYSGIMQVLEPEPIVIEGEYRVVAIPPWLRFVGDGEEICIVSLIRWHKEESE